MCEYEYQYDLVVYKVFGAVEILCICVIFLHKLYWYMKCLRMHTKAWCLNASKVFILFFQLTKHKCRHINLHTYTLLQVINGFHFITTNLPLHQFKLYTSSYGRKYNRQAILNYNYQRKIITRCPKFLLLSKSYICLYSRFLPFTVWLCTLHVESMCLLSVAGLTHKV